MAFLALVFTLATVAGVALLYVVMECAEENLAQVLSTRALTPGEAREMLDLVRQQNPGLDLKSTEAMKARAGLLDASLNYLLARDDQGHPGAERPSLNQLELDRAIQRREEQCAAT